MNDKNIKERIDTDPDFINIKRFEYSLDKLLDRYPDGVPNRIICQALQLSEQEVEDLYQSVILKLRARLAS